MLKILALTKLFPISQIRSFKVDLVASVRARACTNCSSVSFTASRCEEVCSDPPKLGRGPGHRAGGQPPSSPCRSQQVWNHAHAQGGGRADCSSDGVGNVVELEVEEDGVSARYERLNDGGPGCGEELQPNLEPLAGSFESIYQLLRCGRAGHIERDDEALARGLDFAGKGDFVDFRRAEGRLRGRESRIQPIGGGHTQILTDCRRSPNSFSAG